MWRKGDYKAWTKGYEKRFLKCDPVSNVIT